MYGKACWSLCCRYVHAAPRDHSQRLAQHWARVASLLVCEEVAACPPGVGTSCRPVAAFQVGRTAQLGGRAVKLERLLSTGARGGGWRRRPILGACGGAAGGVLWLASLVVRIAAFLSGISFTARLALDWVLGLDVPGLLLRDGST